MRLVTFKTTAGPRAGAVVDSDTTIIDLKSAHDVIEGGSSSENFSSMLALIDGGPAALERARIAVNRAVSAGIEEAYIALESVQLCAPIPNPRRLRDCGCFLLHFRNARAVRHRRPAERDENPEAAFEQFRTEGHLDIPVAWEIAPFYLNSNNLNVIGPGIDIVLEVEGIGVQRNRIAKPADWRDHASSDDN